MKPDTDQPPATPPCAERDAARAFFDGWEKLCLQGTEALFRLGAQGADLVRSIPQVPAEPVGTSLGKTGKKDTRKSGKRKSGRGKA